MSSHHFTLAGAALEARNTGALWWPEHRVLVVSDLHLGKSERIARRSGAMLPPYETQDTLARLDTEIAACAPTCVICLGDSFDDLAASADLSGEVVDWLTRLMAGRRWIWIEGNHDPGPIGLAGAHMAELPIVPLSFRHIADPGTRAEVSGHYHPKASVRTRGRSLSRPSFLIDGDRVIMPAFGTYTGGLDCTAPPLAHLMGPDALAVLTGPITQVIPMPRSRAR